ncbi:FAD-dependent thymidylate synthase [Metasolibacillus sp.]|uniref:FAD-dependent thymidylate synthase n=1 Tax=Metasolibacillus sp. TaxID=2703680 RepID=UPI0025CFF0A4|nr:FAD-dependent thymidylate synthase [Metasolibacillus sp.]MCT6925385.1 FAD-dependent thymidylate synthase [Metasolibacillus sp.]MCT6941587.1 FAD-dependent thymidylate synthase [Metasolibacillus sp.]
MNITLLAHTKLSTDMYLKLSENNFITLVGNNIVDGQVVALAAIRQCYSHKTALEVLETESEKYFGDKGKEGKRLFDHIMKSKHTSTMEHIHFTFAAEGVSRALLAQLTRHRQLSFSVQSQRYNKFSSDSRSGGFDYVTPKTIEESGKVVYDERHNTGGAIQTFYKQCMSDIQKMYDQMIEFGIPQEDARSVLPNATACNLVVSGNLRAWLEFYSKRKKGNGAQVEIAEFAEGIKNAIIEVEPWTSDYFEG